MPPSAPGELADNSSASFKPRVMVRDKHNQRYALWLYDPKDWGSDTLYTSIWDIIAWAYTMEERNALNATVEYYNQLMKENENA